jgi:hypothetical protein
MQVTTPQPVNGGYRQGLLSAYRFLLAASGSFSRSVTYGRSTCCPFSGCNQNRYSSHQRFLVCNCVYKKTPFILRLGKDEKRYVQNIWAFVVPPSFVAASRQQPLWLRATTGLPLHVPDYGGYRQGLLSAGGLVNHDGLINRAPTPYRARVL